MGRKEMNEMYFGIGIAVASILISIILTFIEKWMELKERLKKLEKEAEKLVARYKDLQCYTCKYGEADDTGIWCETYKTEHENTDIYCNKWEMKR